MKVYYCCGIDKIHTPFSFDFDTETILLKIFAHIDERLDWTNVNWTVESKIIVRWDIVVLKSFHFSVFGNKLICFLLEESLHQV